MPAHNFYKGESKTHKDDTETEDPTLDKETEGVTEFFAVDTKKEEPEQQDTKKPVVKDEETEDVLTEDQADKEREKAKKDEEDKTEKVEKESPKTDILKEVEIKEDEDIEPVVTKTINKSFNFLEFFQKNKTIIILAVAATFFAITAGIYVMNTSAGQDDSSSSNATDNTSDTSGGVEGSVQIDFIKCLQDGGELNKKTWPEECGMEGKDYQREFTDEEKVQEELKKEKIAYKSINFPEFTFDYNKTWKMDADNIDFTAEEWDYTRQVTFPITYDDNGKKLITGKVDLTKGDYHVQILMIPFWDTSYGNMNYGQDILFPCDRDGEWNEKVDGTMGRVVHADNGYAYLNNLNFNGDYNFNSYFARGSFMYGQDQDSYFSCSSRDSGAVTGYVNSRFVYNGIKIQSQVLLTIKALNGAEFNQGIFDEVDEMAKSMTVQPAISFWEAREIDRGFTKCNEGKSVGYYYVKDGRAIHYRNNSSDGKHTIYGVDTCNVTLKYNSILYDGQNMWLKWTKVSNLDISTFQEVYSSDWTGYWKDKNNIYYIPSQGAGIIISNGHPSSFVYGYGIVNDHAYDAQDNLHYYYYGKVLYKKSDL